MSRHRTLIVKETHLGLLYEDGILREVLPAGLHQIPSAPSRLGAFFGARAPRVEVVLIDVRSRDRTVVVQDLLTADCATISVSIVVHYRVADPRAAVHQVRNFEERLYVEAQTAVRRTLRSLSLGEVMSGRDEIGEELQIQLRESARAYGLEVSMLDFKDLVLPEELRQALNRAAIASRLRHLQIAEANLDDLGDEDSLSRTEDASTEPEETEVVLARMAFLIDQTSRETTGLRSGLTVTSHVPAGHPRAGSRGSGDSGLEACTQFLDTANP